MNINLKVKYFLNFVQNKVICSKEILEKYFLDDKWKYCESFKLIFDDDNNLIDIRNLK